MLSVKNSINNSPHSSINKSTNKQPQAAIVGADKKVKIKEILVASAKMIPNTEVVHINCYQKVTLSIKYVVNFC